MVVGKFETRSVSGLIFWFFRPPQTDPGAERADHEEQDDLAKIVSGVNTSVATNHVIVKDSTKSDDAVDEHQKTEPADDDAKHLRH